MALLTFRDMTGRPLEQFSPEMPVDGHGLIPIRLNGKDGTILLSELIDYVVELVWNTPAAVREQIERGDG